jgi:hypothetical protein
MKTLFRCLALTPLLALVAACCANSPCNRNDLQADSLYLTLSSGATSPDTVNVSFTRSELDTVYLRRYIPTDSTTVTDPVLLLRKQKRDATIAATLKRAKLDSTTLVISNTAPFPPSNTSGKLNAYNYLLTVHDGAKGAKTYNFRITNIVLVGNYEAKGCCTYYNNTMKTFRVNHKAANDITAPPEMPIAVTLDKRL